MRQAWVTALRDFLTSYFITLLTIEEKIKKELAQYGEPSIPSHDLASSGSL